ncbi:hypothetical protein BJ508DRAFT_319010 [Ascobolus immersus RN42]|uniref:Uncharacterized protein n=1 Tax=Ascobolus immersus RN42 TaxID=1160509 RepID=A0A3N4HVQ9_ASCIM|nr:hypothetical protein BJ508DRAFT_319010 [Ascobolus immersus RN42]
MKARLNYLSSPDVPSKDSLDAVQVGWLDHFIFALAPLGILTAVVSAIRVGGPGWLRAIVGRARENVTTVELELMSSTSEEVCELWNGTGVVRTAGKPEVKEIVCFLVIRVIETNSDTRMRGSLYERAPNISLNLHGGTNPSEQWFATIFGFFLQFGVLVFSGFTAYHPRFRTRLTVEGNVVANFAFPLMATGTTMMTVGLILCSAVVDHGSHEGELSFLDPKSRTEIKAARILWLQRKHEVGDQRFSTYAMFARNKQRDEMLSRILLSRRAKPDQLDATVGALCSLIGFLLQLIAIRQLHWSTSIAHLTALILMSLIRAWLRRGLIITPSAAQVPDEHELDWLALRIGGSAIGTTRL